jgi:hypothetical protein
MRKSILPITGALVLAAAFISCGSGVISVVESPKDQKVISVENGKLVLTYHFTEDVKPGTAILNTTFFVSTDKADTVYGSLALSDSRTLRFVSKLPLKELLPAGGGKISVRMVGSSPFKEWISDMEGNPIDGDRRGDYGGDYRAEYEYKL